MRQRSHDSSPDLADNGRPYRHVIVGKPYLEGTPAGALDRARRVHMGKEAVRPKSDTTSAAEPSLDWPSLPVTASALVHDVLTTYDYITNTVNWYNGIQASRILGASSHPAGSSRTVDDLDMESG